jgi:addiction module HigA family antidote
VIKSFADPETASIWSGRRSRRLPFEIQAVALRKLRLLNQARTLSDLRNPAGQPARSAERRSARAKRSTSNGGSAFDGMKEQPTMSRSSTTMTDEDLLPNPHPGEILALEFMQPAGLSQNALARALHVPPRRINELIHGKRAVSADSDLRLARYFGLSEGFFLGLQADCDLMQRKREIAAELLTIQPRAA